MALHYKLNPLFESISGVISRKRFPDGHVETIVATKKGTIYKRTWNPQKPQREFPRLSSGDDPVMVSRKTRA